MVVVGAGWAGFGAAKHLSEQGYNVKLIEAQPNPGGLSAGWRTPQGRAVEAGMKGFWYQASGLPRASCMFTIRAEVRAKGIARRYATIFALLDKWGGEHHWPCLAFLTLCIDVPHHRAPARSTPTSSRCFASWAASGR